MSKLVENPEDVKQSSYGKIPLSDVVIANNRNLVWGRKWSNNDVKLVLWMLATHSLALFAPYTFTWGAFWAAFCSYVLCFIGITVSYHRNLAHRSLKLPKWLEYTFAYLGVLSFMGDPIFWVSTHRYHHKYVDSENDPHSPTFGFWFSHIGWIFDSGYIIEKYQENDQNVKDLKSEQFYRFLEKTYMLHVFGYVALVYACGGFTYLVWLVGVRITSVYHATFLVNSACHIWGNQTWDTCDLSKNNLWVALVTFGEGWHNNHHAFEYSARHGLEWWEIDIGWYMIRFLEALGLATNVKYPTNAHKLKKSSTSRNKFK